MTRQAREEDEEEEEEEEDEVTMMEPFTLRCAQGGLNTHWPRGWTDVLRQSHHVWCKCGWAFHQLQYPQRNHRNQTRRKTHQEHEKTPQTKVIEMQVGAIQLMVLHFVFREHPCQVCTGTHAPELSSRPVSTFVDSVSREHTQLCNLR